MKPKDNPHLPMVGQREGTTVFINGQPMLNLNAPIATRPQDWAEPARTYLFGEAGPRTRDRHRA